MRSREKSQLTGTSTFNGLLVFLLSWPLRLWRFAFWFHIPPGSLLLRGLKNRERSRSFHFTTWTQREQVLVRTFDSLQCTYTKQLRVKMSSTPFLLQSHWDHHQSGSKGSWKGSHFSRLLTFKNRPVGASFGWGGQLVAFFKSNRPTVHISKIVSEPLVLQRVEQLNNVLTSGGRYFFLLLFCFSFSSLPEIYWIISNQNTKRSLKRR